jgi:hypothetical protein
VTALVHVIDAVIAITLLECVLLSLHHRLTGRGVAPAAFIVNLVSGLCLMLALRAALTGAAAAWVLLPLMLAGLTHAFDLSRRWRTST